LTKALSGASVIRSAQCTRSNVRPKRADNLALTPKNGEWQLKFVRPGLPGRKPPRAVAALLALTLILGGSAAGYGELSKPNVTIDFDRLPVISVDANGASLQEILDRLAGQLGFKVDALASIEHSPTFHGLIKGEVTDVLRRILLREVSYVIFYRGPAIERIVIVASSAPEAGSAQRRAP